MNTRTILQVPLNTTLRKEAERKALAQGFSSLQEVVRVFLNKLAQGTIGVTFEEEILLTPKAIKRYNKILEEINRGRSVFKAKDTSDLVKKLQNAS